MPDAVFKSRHRTRRRRWLWWTAGLVGLAGAAAASIWLFLIVKQQSGQPGGAGAFLAVGGFVAAVLQVLIAWRQLRQGGGTRPVEQLAPHERRERDARDRLHAHLGRHDRLRRMDDPATLALALRVHPAIDLPQLAASSAAASPAARSQPTGWHRLLPRPRHGRPDEGRPLDRDLPTFIDRDKDPKIRAWMRQARDTGGFLLLVGDSCVGKTRLLYEAARQELGDFAVLVPDLGHGDLINKIAEATLPLPSLIVWLDELQRFLDGPHLTSGSTPITATTVRHLLDGPTPVIIVGTLWPEYLTQLRATEPDRQQPTEPDRQQPTELDRQQPTELDRQQPTELDRQQPTELDRQQPRYPNAVDVLNDRRLHHVSLGPFSADERRAAGRLAYQDPRLKEALADRKYHVTAVLAGAPALMVRYENATQEQEAILHAAIDAYHLGIRAPLTKQLLAAAARGYLTAVHPDDTWFPPALTELTTHDRATAPLIPIPNSDCSAVLGYTVADYLLQRLTRQRRSTRLSAVTWQALIDHTHHQDDLLRLALSADRRLLYWYAEPLYRRFANTGPTDTDHWLVTYAAHRLVDLLVRQRASDQQVTDAFQILITGGRSFAERDPENGGNCRSIVRRLVKQGRHEVAMTVLRDWKDAGDRDAAQEWTKLLIEQDRTDQAILIVRTVVELGHRFCIERWFQRLLTEQDQPDKAMAVLRAFTDAGGADAAGQLAETLDDRPFPTHRVKSMSGSEEHIVEWWFDRFVQQGRTEEALTVLRALVDAGGWEAGRLLADLLAKQGDEDALAELWARADAEKERDSLSQYFDPRLADLLAERDNIDELQVRADAGSWPAAYRLADLLVDRGNIDELQARADAGDEAAGKRRARLLVEQGDIEGLQARAGAGDRYAAKRLANLLVDQDRIDAAITIVRTLADDGDWRAQNWLVTLLRKQGNTQEAITLLRARADASDKRAAADWAELLIEQDCTDQALPIATALADTNRQSIAQRWSRRLVEQGRVAEALTVLRALASTGDSFAADRLVDTLITQNRTEDALEVLRARSDTGDSKATDRLAQLLVQQGCLDELRARADAGDRNAEFRLPELLGQQGDEAALAELRTLADHGSWGAAVRLAELLGQQGDDAALAELRIRADTDDHAAKRLAELLGQQGDDAALAELQVRADTDDHAAQWLADLLTKQGHIDKLRYRADIGDGRATERLIDLLDQQGKLDELWKEVDAGTPYVGRRLINLLDRVCEPEQANQQGPIWEAVGTLDADEHLIEDLLHRIGGIEQADRMRSFGLNPDGSIADGNPGGHRPQSGAR